MSALIRKLLHHGRGPYLVAVGLLTLFFGYHCLGLSVDRGNRSMDADNAAQAAIEREFNERFDEGDAIFVAVQLPELLGDSGKKLLLGLAESFSGVDGVREVDSLADNDFEIAPWQEGVLISEDRETAGIRVRLEEFDDNGDRLSRVIEELRGIALDHADDTGARIALTGLPLQKYESGRLVLRDQKIFSPLSFLVLGAVLFFVTRCLSGLFFPLAVSAITICWTLGLYTMTGHTLNMITSLLPPVIMTLSVATTIHIYLDWLHGSESDNRTRILAAVKKLYRPCLFASLTTAIGFLSLLTSQTPAVREFGLFAAIGVMISFVLGLTGLSVGLSYLNARPPARRRLKSGRFATKPLGVVAGLTIHHPRKILTAMAALVVVSVFGIREIRNDTDLLRFLGQDTELYRDTRFIEENLTGPNTIELLLTRHDGQPIDSFAQVEAIEAFEREIQALPHVTHTLSAADILLSDEVAAYRDLAPFETIVEKLHLDHYLTNDLDAARLTVRTRAIGTLEGSRLVDRIREAANASLGETFEVREAGAFYRVIMESNQLIASQLKSFGIAIGLILIAIGAVFRSLRYTLLAFVPNVVPLLLTAALMGFFRIELSTGTAMIASVVIGISVDDTIHYLAAFRRTFDGRADRAIRRTTRHTGFALIATTVALSAGFWVAIFGSFQPTVYFALLSGLTMWLALTCDLLVLPACLHLAFEKRKPLTP